MKKREENFYLLQTNGRVERRKKCSGDLVANILIQKESVFFIRILNCTFHEWCLHVYVEVK